MVRVLLKNAELKKIVRNVANVGSLLATHCQGDVRGQAAVENPV